MNRLEQYIGDLNPSCWLNNQHVNGYGVSQPEDGEEITEWKDISGNNHHAVSTNHGLFIRNSSGIAKTQNNLPAIQFSNNTTTTTGYLGAQFTINGISKADNDFTLVVVGQNTYQLWDVPFLIINRFSAFNSNVSINHNTCLAVNNNINPMNICNIHNLTWFSMKEPFCARPSLLKNLLNQDQTFYSLIYTFDDSENFHEFYNQWRLYTTRTLSKPNNNDYSIVIFNDATSPISSAQPAYKRDSIGQEFIFWNRKLSLLEVKQVQSYIKQKYNI